MTSTNRDSLEYERFLNEVRKEGVRFGIFVSVLFFFVLYLLACYLDVVKFFN